MSRGRRIFSLIIGVLYGLAVQRVLAADPIATALGPAESSLQLAQISSLLAGQYDNEPQRHYLEGMKRGATAPARLNLQIRKLADKPLAFSFEERDGNEHEAVARRGVLTLAADSATREIVMSLDAGGCRWRWSRLNGLWRAIPEGVCDPAAARIIDTTWWLGPEELWLERRAAAPMIELGRARDFDCFVAIEAPGIKPFARTGLKVHDRGGTVRLRTDEPQPRTLELMLRRGMWPSNSGNNLVELLAVYLQEVDAANVIGTGWATPESERVGFGTDGRPTGGDRAVNARCKRIG